MARLGMARALTALAALALGAGGGAVAQQPGETTLYRGGQVWTGSGFEQRDLAVRDGRFVAATRGARVVDIGGQFVVPAYANAHVHLTGRSDAANASFLDHGVYYAWNPNTLELGDEYRAFFARPDTYDAAVAQGGITEPGGHPESIYVRWLGPRLYPDRTLEDFLGDAFHYGRTPAEIDAALDRLVAQQADFVKGYLLYSEEYEARRDDERFYGYHGLNPANARYLVEAARRRGLPVAFHVDTAADLVVAAEAGAAIAAHLPGYTLMNSAYSAQGMSFDPGSLPARTLTAAQARIVAASGMMLTPTYSLLAAHYREATSPADLQAYAAQRAVQAANLRQLAEAGGVFLIGTDSEAQVFDEIEYLDGLRVFPREQLLRIALETGRRMFPARRIGCFDVGCEADFLTLRENPMQDLRALRTIETRIKAGRALPAPAG
ncbi:MAG: amidohydrolase family protein [Hyphomonadaceae bacterium]